MEDGNRIPTCSYIGLSLSFPFLDFQTRLQNSTKWKKIIQDFKDTSVESDVQSRMEPLKDLMTKTMDHLHSILENSVFIAVCRGFWDKMGQVTIPLKFSLSTPLVPSV